METKEGSKENVRAEGKHGRKTCGYRRTVFP